MFLLIEIAVTIHLPTEYISDLCETCTDCVGLDW